MIKWEERGVWSQFLNYECDFGDGELLVYDCERWGFGLFCAYDTDAFYAFLFSVRRRLDIGFCNVYV